MKIFMYPRLASEVAFTREFGIALRHQHWTVWMGSSCHLLPFIQLLDSLATLAFYLITKGSNLCLTIMWLTDLITKWVHLATCLLLQAVLNHTQHMTSASRASWKPYFCSAKALFCLPSSQHTEREVLLKEESRKKREMASVPDIRESSASTKLWKEAYWISPAPKCTLWKPCSKTRPHKAEFVVVNRKGGGNKDIVWHARTCVFLSDAQLVP